MRNLKRALSLALATVMTLGLMVVGTGAVGYQDVDRSDNQEAIEVLQAVGIMTGVTDDEFDPDGLVTRNQIAVIMANLLNLDYDYYRGINPFTDVPSWAAPYVAACAAEGVVAGIGGGLYGGENNVTAAQAALMLMKALGYFQYQGDFNPDWQVATVRQASYIGLFSGVDSNADAALTRGQVAQMVLNALKADMVYFTGTVGTELTLPDGTKYTAGYVSEYTPRTSSDRQYNTLIDDTSDIAGTDRYIIQLGEELYDGDLRQTASSDAFMRPATTWRYDNETIGTYPDDADLTYTEGVRIGDIYNDLGLSKGIPARDTTVYEDGVLSTSTNNTTQWTDYDIVKGQRDKIGGNGTLTEVYYDAADDSVIIVITNTYVAQINAAYDETSTQDAYVVLKTATPFTLPAGASSLTYETEDFAKDDIVAYTYSFKDGDEGVQSMELAEPVTGAMSTYTTTGSVTVAGDKYDANRKSATNIASFVTTVDKGDDVVVYLDEYGFALYVDADVEVNYAVVLNYTPYAGDWNKTAKAELFFTDGTVKTVEVDAVSGARLNTQQQLVVDNTTTALSKYDVVSYVVDSDDVYTLTLVADARTSRTGGGFDLKNGATSFGLTTSNAANLMGGTVSCHYADGETVFLVADTSRSKTVYSVYEGIANVPTITHNGGSNAPSVTVFKAPTDACATVVFVEKNAQMTLASDNQDVIYVKGSNVQDSYTSELGHFYEYDAFINGQPDTIKVDHTSAMRMTQDALIYGPIYNEKGIMTNFAERVTVAGDPVSTDHTYVITGTVGVVNDVVTLGVKGTTAVPYAYVSDANVYRVSVDGDLTAITMDSIGEDTNDVVFYRTNDDGKLTDVYVKVVDQPISVPGSSDYTVTTPLAANKMVYRNNALEVDLNSLGLKKGVAYSNAQDLTLTAAFYALNSDQEWVNVASGKNTDVDFTSGNTTGGNTFVSGLGLTTGSYRVILTLSGGDVGTLDLGTFAVNVP